MANSDADTPLRSVNSNEQVYVCFCNESNRTVHLFWINFSGKLHRYAKLLPKTGVSIDTFVTHPWAARDCVTGFPLMFDGYPVFHPQPQGEHEHERRDIVTIDIPVYPLYKRCLETLHYSVHPRVVEQADIPTQLKEAMKKFIPVFQFSDYRHFNSIEYIHLCEDIAGNGVNDGGDDEGEPGFG